MGKNNLGAREYSREGAVGELGITWDRAGEVGS
jgi:hypothetical protein